MKERMFSKRDDFKNLSDVLDKWTHDEMNVKDAFLRLVSRFWEKNQVVLSFVPRPGISYSFRAGIRAKDEAMTLVTLIDIVDDDPDNKWLSVCFYDDCVTDPAEKGNMVPKGVLGVDGYCFDLYENNNSAVSYLEQRIDEAYENTLKE
jgi:hypothetical protein